MKLATCLKHTTARAISKSGKLTFFIEQFRIAELRADVSNVGGT
jgi:hypothetical protein